ncbi:DNA polymerase delta small subunit [Operophtera brumata]|uniref:DNA polymerase delta small subunit n=1 Tax=Operophtera brumata TaxID=104452 RepID=A0A0L7LMU8_OPEBR|nr:DNA polymerase delta small subunit [Operophtera brumata]
MLFKIESGSTSKSGNEFQTVELDRQNVDYTDCSKRFYQVSRDFSKQYAHIYSARLNTFRNILAPAIKKKWSNTYKILKLCELRDKGTTCIIVGTIFKHQELKPSILKELSDQLEIIPQPTRTYFVADSDSLVLEDELQRIKLVGDCIDVHQVVTGVVCAILGSEDEDGIFTVKDVCWPGCHIQKPLPKLNEDRFTAEHMVSLHLLMEWLCGLAGSSEYQGEISNIVRVIVAGGVFANYSTEKVLNESDVIASAELVDSFAASLSAVVPFDLMPGCKDPTGIMLPQKPFHYCLFPKATEYKTFNRVSNPYECDIGGFLCLGTSGEPIKDIMRYSKLDNSLDVLKKTLEWRHLGPTCPDTVPCTPCIDTDPFTIYNCPAIYFSGNSDKFATELYKGEDGQRVRLVCVPDFCESQTVAVVNLASLECHSMTFS